MSLRIAFRSLTLLVLPLAIASGQDAPKATPPGEAKLATRPEVKPAATPEAALAMMVAGAKAGDLDATFGPLVEEQARPLRDWFKAQASLAAAINAYSAALDVAFGKDPSSPIKPVDFGLKAELEHGFSGYRFVGTPRTIDADHVAYKVIDGIERPVDQPKAREGTATARRDDGGWRLMFDEFGETDFDGGTAFLVGLRDGLVRTTAAIKDGSIKSRADATKDLERDRAGRSPERIPLPRFLAGPR